jgi:NADH:ubiquinone oxidoreductase subunit 5 (subunit L)/multisubunit Na+/H+ antiporter MnhA subunit
MESEFTGETIATMILVPLALLLCLALFVGLRMWSKRASAKSTAKRSESSYGTDWDAETARLTRRWSWAGPVIAVLVVVATWWGIYPWESEYHQWVPKSGVVETIDSRLVAMEGKFVVKFQGDDQQYGVLDTRASGVRTGDQLTITCVRRWQWSGSHGFDCNFVSLEKGGKR